MKHKKAVLILAVVLLSVGFAFFVPFIHTSYPPYDPFHEPKCEGYGCEIFYAYGSLSYQYLGIGGVTVPGITQYQFVT
jgi:hypothetical protein